MAINDFFQKSQTDLAVDDELIVDGSTSETGAVEIHEIFGSGSVNIFKEIQTGGSGDYNLSVNISSQSDVFHSQGNQIEVSDNAGVRIRMVNNGDSVVDYAVNGIEVSP
jgi:hypothetical protein